MTDNLPADAYGLELERICPPKSHPLERGRMERALAWNQRSWRALLAEDPVRGSWLLLDALVARIEATEELGSIIYAARIDACRDIAKRLIRQHGAAVAWSIPQAWHVARSLLQGTELRAFEYARLPPVAP